MRVLKISSRESQVSTTHTVNRLSSPGSGGMVVCQYEIGIANVDEAHTGSEKNQITRDLPDATVFIACMEGSIDCSL